MSLTKYTFIFVTIFSFFASFTFATNTSYNNYFFDEVQSLSDLPIDKLIKIKSSFSKKYENDGYDFLPESRASSALAVPVAMPYKRVGSNNKPMRRYDDEWDDKGKDSKISKIFQLTVTALSFLAFGGYLLTLIITAIRRNQNNTNQGNQVIVLSTLQRLQNIKRPKRGLIIYDPTENDYQTEKLYRSMIMLSSELNNRYYQ